MHGGVKRSSRWPLGAAANKPLRPIEGGWRKQRSVPAGGPVALPAVHSASLPGQTVLGQLVLLLLDFSYLAWRET